MRDSVPISRLLLIGLVLFKQAQCLPEIIKIGKHRDVTVNRLAMTAARLRAG